MQGLVGEVAVARQYGLDGAQQLGELLLLAHIPRRPRLHAAHREVAGGLRCQHQHLAARAESCHATDHLQAIQLGDTDIEHHDIRQVLPCELQRSHPIVGFRHDVIPMPLHQHAYGQAYDRMIIHDKHFIHAISIHCFCFGPPR
ncbi:hypothetical protein D3C79_729740 [compost metagenome]